MGETGRAVFSGVAPQGSGSPRKAAGDAEQMLFSSATRAASVPEPPRGGRPVRRRPAGQSDLKSRLAHCPGIGRSDRILPLSGRSADVLLGLAFVAMLRSDGGRLLAVVVLQDF